MVGPGSGTGLAVRDAVVRYGGGREGRGPGTTAVAGVSLDVAPGEVVALLGPSGCGKSSLLRAVAGLEPVAGGTVAWDGRDLAGVPVHRRGFGLMFQDGQLFPHRDVAGNVAYGLAGRPRAERVGRVAELLDVVGLAGYERRAVATLSGGERQRVALARSLAPGPRLLLLDEPLSALDRGLRERLAGDLRAVLVGTGTTAVYFTHDHDEAFTVADRVAVMGADERGGRLLQVAPPEELWRAPASRVVAAFLGYQAFVPLDASAAPDGALLAIGPRGLRVVDVDDPPAEHVAAGRPERRTDPGDMFGGSRGMVGRVVAAVLRRGVAEVTVDVVLPGERTERRLVAVAGHDAGRAAVEPGDAVTVVLDEAGCAVVPAG